jgi:hypothetical protein
MIHEDITYTDRRPFEDGLGLLVARSRIQNPEKHPSAGRLRDIFLVRLFRHENRIDMR